MAVLVSSSLLVALAGCGDDGGEKARAVRAPWAVASVDPDAKGLEVVIESGGCASDERAAATESAGIIRIRATRREPDGNVACSLVLRLARVRVSLDEPLSGRPIEGLRRLPSGTLSPRFVRRRDTNGLPLVFVPNVAGLSARDAVTVLNGMGFEPELKGDPPSAEVVGTEPAAGQRVPAETELRVVVRR